MEISITPDQQALIRQAIESGRIERPEDAGSQAMALWAERERKRAEILTAVDQASASLQRGEGIAIADGTMRELADDVKRRGRERLAAEAGPHR